MSQRFTKTMKTCVNDIMVILTVPLREKCPNTELFLVRIEYGEIRSKYGPEITPYLDIFHAVSPLDEKQL